MVRTVQEQSTGEGCEGGWFGQCKSRAQEKDVKVDGSDSAREGCEGGWFGQCTSRAQEKDVKVDGSDSARAEHRRRM